MKIGFCTTPNYVVDCRNQPFDYIELYMSELMDMTPRQFALFYFKECVRRAKTLGVLTCVLGSGDARSTDLSDEIEKNKLVQFLKVANVFCKENAISFGVEAMSRSLCDTLNTAMETSAFLVDNKLTDIGVVIDTFHMNDICEKCQ